MIAVLYISEVTHCKLVQAQYCSLVVKIRWEMKMRMFTTAAHPLEVLIPLTTREETCFESLGLPSSHICKHIQTHH